MGTEERSRADLLKAFETLEQLAPRMGFFALVPWLERLVASDARVGSAASPSEESIRFRHDPALAFSTGDVTTLRISRTGPLRAEVLTTFLGLTGSVSPLPTRYAEEVVHEDHDEAVRQDFLDVFHHRAVSLLYRAVARYRLPTEHGATNDPWPTRFVALGGVAGDATSSYAPLDMGDLVRLLPLLASGRPGARTLLLALKIVLGRDLPVDVEIRLREHVPDWTRVPEEQRFRLGEASHALGKLTTVGPRVPDRGSRFAIRVGPLDRATFERFIHSGELLARTAVVVDLFVREPLVYDVELLLAAEHTRGFTLGGNGSLARTAWLGSSKSDRVLVVRPQPESER